MDSLSSFGSGIGEALQPTYKLYASLLAAQSTSFKSTAKSTYSYGQSPRQTLDVYHPSGTTTPKKNDKLNIFLYGGGFFQGDKVLDNLPEAYGNVGCFFAEKHGIETIVIDYRLVSHGARFPSGGEDIDAALQWVEKQYQGKNITLLGTSAGGVHICTFLFGSEFRNTREKLVKGSKNKLAAAVLVGTPFDSEGVPPMMLEMTAPYFGEDQEKKQPVSLLRRGKREGTLSLPRMLVLDSELDPGMIQRYHQVFVQELKDSNAAEVEYWQIKGHNHFSPFLALGTGIEKEEEWGHSVSSWLSQ